MATIQQKNVKGNKYWYIVESRRVNGKPRPVVLAYLGKADDLLKRLQGNLGFSLKSYSHGTVAALIDVAAKLDVAGILNKHVKSTRSYMSEKPVRNNLTAGVTFCLGPWGVYVCRQARWDGGTGPRILLLDICCDVTSARLTVIISGT